MQDPVLDQPLCWTGLPLINSIVNAPHTKHTLITPTRVTPCIHFNPHTNPPPEHSPTLHSHSFSSYIVYTPLHAHPTLRTHPAYPYAHPVTVTHTHPHTPHTHTPTPTYPHTNTNTHPHPTSSSHYSPAHTWLAGCPYLKKMINNTKCFLWKNIKISYSSSQ